MADRVTMTGRVVSIRHKEGAYGNYWGVTVVTSGTRDANDEKLAWFRQTRHDSFDVGDTITFVGTPDGGSDDGKMTFVKRVKVGDSDCGHFRLIRTVDVGYCCENCGDVVSDTRLAMAA